MDLNRELEAKLEILLLHFGDEVLLALDANITKYNLTSSSELKRSLSRSLIRSEQNKLCARISFSVQGKMRDMQPKYPNKMPPVDQIMEWMEAKGISKFTNNNGNSSPVDTDQKRRIAWGIAMSKKITPTKRVPWKNKTISAGIGKLTEEILNQYSEVTGLSITQIN